MITTCGWLFSCHLAYQARCGSSSGEDTGKPYAYCVCYIQGSMPPIISNLRHRKNSIMVLVAVVLAVLVLSLFIYFIFRNPNPTQAATLSLTTTDTTIQIDVPHRYRAILSTQDETNYYDFLKIYDRAENDSNPDLVASLESLTIREEGTYYELVYDAKRKTTVLESTNSRIRIRVEGKLNTSAGGSYLNDGTDDLTVQMDITFTTEGIYISSLVDFQNTGITIDNSTNTDYVFYADMDFNISSVTHSETVYAGNGATEETLSGNNWEWDSTNNYVVAQATGSYQDLIFGNSQNGRLDALPTAHTFGYELNLSGEMDGAYFYIDGANDTGTITGLHASKSFLILKSQYDLDTEAEREAIYNDLANPDNLDYTTGSQWDDNPGSPGIYFNGNVGGSDTHIRLPNNIYDSLTEGTIELWFRPDDVNNGRSATGLFGAAEDDDYGWSDVLNLNYDQDTVDRDVGFYIINNGSVVLELYSPVNSIVPLHWYHVAVTASSSDNTVRIYLNGQEVANSNGTLYWIDDIAENTTAYTLGCLDTNGSDTQNCDEDEVFQGNIDEVRIWNYARTQAEIQQNMYKQIAADEEGLVGYFRMNENTGTTTHDETTNNNDGTISGATWTTGYVPDHYNEAEGAYTLDMSANQTEFDIDGGNNFSTTLSAAVTPGATSVSVASVTGFPTPGVAYTNGDKFSYSGVSGSTLTGIPTPPASQLDIIGHASGGIVSLMNRHFPFFKLRNWRNNTEPASITLEDNQLTKGTDYNADIKPFTTAYFAQDLTMSYSLEDATADVGSNLTQSGGSFVAGRYGKGFESNADADDLNVSVTEGTDFEKEKGTVEFWYQPYYDHNDGSAHYLFNFNYDTNNRMVVMKSTGNDLQFNYKQGGTSVWYNIDSADYSWKAYDWINIRVEWDDSEPTETQQRIYINGVEPTHTDSGTNMNGASMTSPNTLLVGNYTVSSNDEADGIIDEFKVYSSDDITRIAAGGDTSDTDEYLADLTNNYTFDFNDDDANNRGEYIWLGSDSQFQGVNLVLATPAVGSSQDFDWEYWNGTAWSALTTTEQDSGASDWTGSGNFYFTAPGNWFPYSVNGSTDQYFIRGHLESGSYSTNPVENTIKTDILLFNYLKSDITTTDRTFQIPGFATANKGSSPIASWSMDEGYGSTTHDSAVIDESGTLGDHDLTITNATWEHTSDGLDPPTTYLEFDGAGDYLSRAYDADFDFGTDSFSISGWFKHSSTAPASGTDTIMARYGTAGFKIYMDTSGYVCFGVDGDNTWGPDASACSGSGIGSFADSRWHHFEAVKNGTTSVLLYIDAKLMQETTAGMPTGSLSSSSTLYLGIDSDGLSNGWEGFLDNISMYHYARTAAQVKTEFNDPTAASFGSSPYDTLTDGLVGWWRMDESSANSCTGGSNDSCDSSGNQLDAAWQNNTTYTTGKYGNGVTLDGTDDYLSVSDPGTNSALDFGTNGSITISAWIKPTSLPTSGNFASILTKGQTTGTTDFNYVAQYYSTGSLEFCVGESADSTWGCSNTNETPVTAGVWQHVVYTFTFGQGSSMKFYYNGQELTLNESGLGGISPDVSNEALWIGADDYDGGSPDEEVNGTLDDVRIYNRALSPREVEQLYHWGAPPVGYWSMDENTGTGSNAVKDHSGNANDGTMTAHMTESDWVTGKFGSALNFDADYVLENREVVTITTPSNIYTTGDSQGTITFWMQPMWDSTTTTSTYVMIGNLSGGDWFDIFFCGSDICSGGDIGGFFFEAGNDGAVQSSVKILNGNYSWNSGEWIHVTATWDDTLSTNDMHLYLNGLEPTHIHTNEGSLDLSALSLLDSHSIGGEGALAGFLFDGLIDDVRIYNYARTQEQIIQDMNAGHPVGGSPVGSQVGYWKFDEGYGDTAHDSSPQGNDGDLAGSGTTCPTAASACPSWNPVGKINNTLQFDGNDDFIDAGSNTSLDNLDTITITAWIKPLSLGEGSYGRIFQKSNTTLNGRGFYLNPNNAVTYYHGWSTATSQYAKWDTASNSITLNQWQHVAVTYDKSSTDNDPKIYINGIEQTLTESQSPSGASGDDSAGTLYIGNRSTSDRTFDGFIDELKIYSAILTPDQILIDYNQGKAAVLGSLGSEVILSPTPTIIPAQGSWSTASSFCVPGDTSYCAPPVGWWKMDENTGTTYTYDSSGNNNTGSLGGSMTASDWVPGKFGSALDFDGGNDNINVGSATALDDLGPFTFSAWMFPRSEGLGGVDGDGRLFSKGGTGYLQAILWKDTETRCFNFQKDYTDTDLNVEANCGEYNYNSWTHVAITWDGSSLASNVHIYFNGKETTYDQQQNGSGDINSDSGSDMFIGNISTFDTGFDGLIDDVRIYNYVRTPAQIAWDYNRGAPIAWWKLDECSGTTAYDSSKNGNDDSNGNTGTITIGSGGINTSAGTCSSGNSSEAWNNGTSGKRNASLDFDGTDDYISFNSSTLLQITGDQTISAWIYKDTSGTAQNIVDHGASGETQATNHLYEVTINASNYIEYFWENGTGSNTTVTSSVPLNTTSGAWDFITVTRDTTNNQVVFYENGQQLGTTQTYTNDPDGGTSGVLYIGRAPDISVWFNGRIDDVRIDNYALTAQQIKMLYNEGAAHFGN
jgi:hypothetical protein